jgi:hypothetical protein
MADAVRKYKKRRVIHRIVENIHKYYETIQGVKSKGEKIPYEDFMDKMKLVHKKGRIPIVTKNHYDDYLIFIHVKNNHPL